MLIEEKGEHADEEKPEKRQKLKPHLCYQREDEKGKGEERKQERTARGNSSYILSQRPLTTTLYGGPRALNGSLRFRMF